ncbi:MAG TPA: NAD-dependent epimerase/dehydratase family protein, partial [Bacillota bacterium]|nr:NAD-dependent epimerase/dehydratase family protein [Bacillota bacterium]
MKCLVTGATGHIGNVLVKELFHEGYQVTSLVLPNDDISMIEPYTNILYGNILDIDFLINNVVDFDIVFHLAGIVEIGTGKKKKIYKVNVG